MNGAARRLLQRAVEMPIFVRFGLDGVRGKDVVELGCGNGYGASLIGQLAPRSFVGLDIMPEQIALAARRAVPNARFFVGDAASVDLTSECADVVVIFGILHHLERWKAAVEEARRLLRPGGVLFVDEPHESLLRTWDRVFRWGHPVTGFSLVGLESELSTCGLVVDRRLRLPGVFAFYGARRERTSPSG